MPYVRIANLKGKQGDRGLEGPPGAANELQAGDVQFVAPTDPLEVTVRGAAPHQVVDMKIPRQIASPTAEATDSAVSGYVNSGGTATRTALDNRYAGRTIHVLMLMGQSNMSGRGVLTNAAATDPVHERIWQFGSKVPTLRAASEPLDMHDTPSGIGPGLQIARRMIDSLPAGDEIVLVPAAHGGTPLSSNAVLAWRWGVAGNLTSQAISQTDAAITAAKAQWPGATVAVKGIFWVQGEQDGYNTVTAATYQADLETLIAGLQEKYGAKVPFVMGQMLKAYLSTGTASQINWAQTKTAKKSARFGFALGPTEQNGDGVHYSAAGQRKLAASMYAEWVRSSAGLAPAVKIEPPTGVLVTDDFTRADGPVGSTPAGQAWLGQPLGGGTLIPAMIISGALGQTSSSGAWSYWTLDTGAQNYTLTTKVGLRNGSRVSPVVLAYVDPDNWMGLYLNGAGNTYQLLGRVGATSTAAVTSSVVQSDGDLIKAEVKDGVVTVWAGASGTTLVGSTPLPGVIIEATRAGFGFHPTSANTWDYLTATAT